jgi:hypothetical protein
MFGLRSFPALLVLLFAQQLSKTSNAMAEKGFRTVPIGHKRLREHLSANRLVMLSTLNGGEPA